VFGSFQRWWLEPMISSLSNTTLFFGATGLTAITDNAALTYFGSQVPNLSDLSKWALVAGALVGGGLTILANAPNPAGFSILAPKFPDSSLNAIKLFKAAFIPTLVALVCFYIKVFIFV
jgi:Na+/H+ antiporter NhaD/arsenite permease-like protein